MPTVAVSITFELGGIGITLSVKRRSLVRAFIAVASISKRVHERARGLGV